MPWLSPLQQSSAAGGASLRCRRRARERSRSSQTGVLRATARCQMTRTVASTAALLLMGLMGAACDQPATAPSEIAHPGPSGEGYQQRQASLAGRDDVSTATWLREWALAADAEGDVLMDAFVRRDGVLGLIVAPSATPDRVRGDDRVPRVVNGKAVSRAPDRADRLPGRAGDGADCREPPNGFTGNRHRALRP